MPRRTSSESAGPVVGPLKGICLYLLFFMFNISGKGRDKGNLASDKKGPVICHMRIQFCFHFTFSIFDFKYFI